MKLVYIPAGLQERFRGGEDLGEGGVAWNGHGIVEPQLAQHRSADKNQAWIRLLTQNSWVLTEGYFIVWFQRIEVAFLAETPSTTTSCSLSGEL